MCDQGKHKGASGPTKCGAVKKGKGERGVGRGRPRALSPLTTLMVVWKLLPGVRVVCFGVGALGFRLYDSKRSRG